MDTAPAPASAAAPATPSNAPSQDQSKSSSQTSSGSPTTSTPSVDDTWEIKVDGKPVKLSRQEVIDRASMAHAAQQRFDEASKIRKREMEREAKYKDNPMQSFLDQTEKLSPEQRRELIEKYYAEQFIDPETLSPDQKRAKELERENAEYKKKIQEREDQERQTAEERETAQHRENLQVQIIEAMEASGLPKTPSIVKQIALLMRQNLKNGWEAPMDMIVRQVKVERENSYREDFKSSSPEQIIALMGPDLMMKIRKHDLEQLRTKRQGTPFQASNKNTEDSFAKSLRDKMDSTDVEKNLRDLKRNGF